FLLWLNQFFQRNDTCHYRNINELDTNNINQSGH
ncbi:MAG: hypothetical protein ACI9ES_001172, partial [Oceanospirillaceae bacterium]